MILWGCAPEEPRIRTTGERRGRGRCLPGPAPEAAAAAPLTDGGAEREDGAAARAGRGGRRRGGRRSGRGRQVGGDREQRARGCGEGADKEGRAMMGNGGDAGRGGRRWGAMIGQVWRLGVQVGCQGPGGLCGVSGWSLGVPGRVCRV